VVVALLRNLLGLGEQRLNAFAQLHERVTGVGLLHDPGDQLADAVLVLVEHHVPLGLADPLEDHLLRRLRGDAAEVVRRDVTLVDLIAVLRQHLGIELWVFRLAHLAGLGIDLRLRRLDLGQQLLLELIWHEQLEDTEVGRVALHIHTRVLGRAGLLLVRGQEGILERKHQSLGGDALLALEQVYRFDDLLGHLSPSPPTGCSCECRRREFARSPRRRPPRRRRLPPPPARR
jgi:hypothetical protein